MIGLVIVLGNVCSIMIDSKNEDKLKSIKEYINNRSVCDSNFHITPKFILMISLGLILTGTIIEFIIYINELTKS